MGKRQHQKDKMYLTCTEWSTLYGGKKAASALNGATASFKRLPFHHCSLSLQKFENPVCDKHGNLFDILAIVPYIKKFKINPVTGEPLDSKGLIRLKFAVDTEGDYQCPVLFKSFTDKSHMVANKLTGNVFSFEAIEQLNIKTKNWKDLLTDEPFKREDLITLQDPGDLTKFNISNFHHIKNEIRIEDEELVRARTDPAARLKKVAPETKDILEELEREYKAPEKVKEAKKAVADKFNAAPYSTGMVAAGFTSTVMAPLTTHEAAILDDDVVRYSRIKKKGYVRLLTNLGPLNVELHCDTVPKTCENFLKLSQQGYYNGTKFHRSIKYFMVQGGDPTGTGRGGQSYWDKPFPDEIKPNLSHDQKGVLAMANSGPDTNKSQFFITYRACKHLDKKHTVFGKVVGGLETLNAIERVETDNKDVPIEDIVIEQALVFVDPYTEVDEQLVKEREEDKQQRDQKNASKAPVKKKDETPKVYSSSVGKYINPATVKVTDARPPAKKKATATGYNFGNFGSW